MGNKIEFTEIQKRDIVDLYTNQNMSLRRIAKIYSCNFMTIRKLLDSCDVKIRQSNDDAYHKISERDKDIIVKMFLNGYRIIDIANEFGVADSWICKILDKNDVEHHKIKISTDRYEDVVAMYRNGNTIEYIANYFNVSESLIGLILHSCNVDINKPKDYVRIYKFNENYFDNVDIPNKAYILGFLYADGCNHSDRNCITLSLQDVDKEILEKMNKELENEKPLYFYENSKYNNKWHDTYTICLFSEHMSNVLSNKGCTPRKSLTLKFPDWLQQELIRHFVRGYFDGDGCVYYDEKRHRCQASIVSSKFFCDGLSGLMRELGLKHSIEHANHNNENTRTICVCGNKSCLDFLSWIYDDADLYLERKYQKYKNFKEWYLNKINT